MDKFQFWLYLLIGIGYLLSRLRTKPKEEAAPKPTSRPKTAVKPASTPVTQRPAQPSAAAPKALTFEELLREIAASKEPQPAEMPPPRKSTPTYSQEATIDDEAEDLEDVNYDYRKYNNTYNEYEEARAQAFARPSLEETVKLEDTVVNFGRFKEFDRTGDRNLMDEYLKDFKDPEGLKKAVVLSEVLRPKF